jgi:hypothetical protein
MAFARKQLASHQPPLPSTVDAFVHVVVSEYAALHHELRIWRWWVVAVGVVQVGLGSMLGMPCGIVLLVIGGASFVAHEAVLLVVYSIVLLGSAVVNVSSLHWDWALFALVQTGYAVPMLRCYVRHRAAEAHYARLTRGLDIGLPPPVTYAASVLPWLGAAAGMLAFGLSVLTQHTPGSTVSFVLFVPLDLAVVGLALCGAALVARRGLALALLGVFVSALTMVGWTVALATGQLGA